MRTLRLCGEFALETKGFKMPVGRVSFMYMTPLSFMEYLDAIGEGKAKQAVLESSVKTPVPEYIHNHLLRHVKDYMLLGGMPAVIHEYIQTKQMQKCRNIQSDILLSFQADFGKYATKAETAYLQKVFEAVPQQAGKKFKYAALDPHIKTAFLKNAVDLLEKAGIVHKIRRTSEAGIPLGANATEKGYKVIFMDVGLLQNMCGLDVDIMQAQDLLTVNSGAVAEQFTGQELMACASSRKNEKLFFWYRDAKNSSAEVDYLVSRGNKILPVEVKSGATGRLKSLFMFMEKYNVERGYKVSQEPQAIHNQVESVPLYAVGKLYRDAYE